MLLRFISIISIVVGLAGCAAVSPPPPAPTFTLPKGAKVGLLVVLDSTAVHTHVGTTVFNNFSVDKKLKMDLGKEASNAFANAITAVGAEVVNLSGSGFKPEDLNALITPAGGAWKQNPAQAANFKKLKEDLGLAGVVIVYGQPTMASLECTGGPCTPRYVKTAGLFTRSFFGMTNYFAVAAIETRVFLLAPPANLSAVEPLAGVAKNKVTVLRNMPDPENLKNMTEEEFKPVVAWIGTYVEQMARATGQALAGRP